MDKQEVFNKVYTHLITQGAKSLDPDTPNHYYGGACMYRGKDSLQCAVGCLIKDEHYSKRFEGQDANDEVVLDAIQASYPDIHLDEPMKEMLNRLQSVHDNMGIEHWRNSLTNVAERYDLTVPIVYNKPKET